MCLPRLQVERAYVLFYALRSCTFELLPSGFLFHITNKYPYITIFWYYSMR